MSSGVPVRTDRPSGPPSAPVAVMTEPKALKRMLGSERPMALAHHPGEQDARRPHQGPGHDEEVAVQGEARGGHGQAGEGVEQRDEDGDVGAADGEDEDDPEGERQDERRRPAAPCWPSTTVAMSMARMARPTTALIGCWPL